MLSLVPSGYSLVKTRDNHVAGCHTHSNLANRAQALSVAKEMTAGTPGVRVFGFLQRELNESPMLAFIVRDGEELPLFEVTR
jgi:hypothetical protein